MTIFYSPKELGFYDTNFHQENEIPEDVIEITKEEYSALLDGNSKGKNIVPDENGFPILHEIQLTFVELKQNKVNEIASASQSAANALTVGYPDFEQQTWPTQQAECTKWFSAAEIDRVDSLVPWCAAAAKARGLELTDFMTLVQNNVTAFIQASSVIAGKRQKLVSEINAYTDDTADNRATISSISWG